MVLDFRRVATAARTPRRQGTAGDEPLNEHAAVLAMQASAGNRATRAALAQVTAQRAVGGRNQAARRSESAGGELTLVPLRPLRVLSASWAQEATVKVDQAGMQRQGEVVPVKLAAERIVVTMPGDKDNPRQLLELEQTLTSMTTFKTATLRLDRRSADGKLPATLIDLSDVVITSVSRTDDDPPQIRIELAVGGLSAAGLGKDSTDAGAVGNVAVTSPSGWAPMPMLAWDRERTPEEARPSGSGPMPMKAARPSTVSRFRATVKAGPNVARLSEAMANAKRLTMVYTPKGGGPVVELIDVLVERMAGSSAGPAEVDIVLVAELVKTR